MRGGAEPSSTPATGRTTDHFQGDIHDATDRRRGGAGSAALCPRIRGACSGAVARSGSARRCSDRRRAQPHHSNLEVHPRRVPQGLRRLCQGEVERHREGERHTRGHAGRLRAHRGVEGQAGGGHFLGGESALFEKLAEQKLLQKLEISRAAWESIPASIGKPKAIPLKDKDGYWVGTALEPYGLVYHPRRLQRLGVAELKDWEDLLNPKLKGEVAQCAPTRSSSSNATYEVMLSMLGEEKGWEWLTRLAANTGHFTARSRDVPTVIAKGEFTAGFAVPSYMAFEEKLAGFDIKFVAPRNAFVTPEPMAILAGARNPKAARAFVEFLLTERGQKVFMERGLFPITPKYAVQGAPGSTAELAVQFTGGLRAYFDRDVSNVYDEAVAGKRSEALKTRFHSDIEAVWKKP